MRMSWLHQNQDHMHKHLQTSTKVSQTKIYYQLTREGGKISFFSVPLILILILSQGVSPGQDIFGLRHSVFPHLSFCLQTF